MRKKPHWNTSAPTIGDVEKRFLKKGGPNVMVNPRGLRGGTYGAASEGVSYRQQWLDSNSNLTFAEWLEMNTDTADR